MQFKKIFPTFATFQKILLSFDVPSANIQEIDYNYVKALISDNSLFTDDLQQLYANLALQWNEQYNIYQQQLPFYTKKLDDLNQQINTAIQGLYDLASNENNTFQFDIKNFTKADMNKYLSGFTADTRDQAKAYIDNFQNFNNYFQTLRANNPRINFYKNVITEITLPLNTKSADIYADFWKIENSCLKNNTKLPIDNDMQVIKNVAAALNSNEVPNLAQVKSLIPKDTNLWIENAGQLQPKKAQLVSVLNQKIASVADATNPQDAVNKKQLDAVSAIVTNNTNTLNQEKQTIAAVQATANNNTKVGVINNKNINTNKTAIASNIQNINTNKVELAALENRTTTSFFSKVEGSPVQQIKNIEADAATKLELIVANNTLKINEYTPPDAKDPEVKIYNFKTNNTRNYENDIQNWLVKLDFQNKNYEIKLLYKFDWNTAKNYISGEMEFYFGKDFKDFFTNKGMRISNNSVQNYANASDVVYSICEIVISPTNGVTFHFHFKDKNTTYRYDTSWNPRFSVLTVTRKEI